MLDAYGWPRDIADDLLARLLALNLERAAASGAADHGAEADEEDETNEGNERR